MSSGTRLLIDFGPLAVFFVVFRTSGMLPATAALVIATLIALGFTYAKERKIPPMPLVTAIAVTFFGGLTLFFKDDIFIKMKPTIVNLFFASALFIGIALKKPVLKYVLEHALTMQEEGWRKLSLRWAVFFIFLALLNEVIWRNFPTDFWVNFKVFGMFTLTILFTCAQVPLLKRYMIEEPAVENPPAL